MRLHLRTFDWTGGPRPTYVRLLYQFDFHSLQDSMDLRHTEKLRSLYNEIAGSGFELCGNVI